MPVVRLCSCETAPWELASCAGSQIDTTELFALRELETAWQQRQLVQGERKAETWRYLCFIPLISRDELSGLLVVADREERGGQCGPFAEEHMALLQSFAGQAGTALHNARLHRRLGGTCEQLEQAQRKLAQLEQLRALAALAAELTHAMRHMLGVIIGRADLYLSIGGDPAQRRDRRRLAYRYSRAADAAG
jgi:GAF domain-containing protein